MLDSRSGELSPPRKYFCATMLVAVEELSI